uniref:Uncharacterized protein n=1 Tax=Physcomitrium patens TaxID=3218 RepID=A0A7I4AS72_PHYPA
MIHGSTSEESGPIFSAARPKTAKEAESWAALRSDSTSFLHRRRSIAASMAHALSTAARKFQAILVRIWFTETLFLVRYLSRVLVSAAVSYAGPMRVLVVACGGNHVDFDIGGMLLHS